MVLQSRREDGDHLKVFFSSKENAKRMRGKEGRRRIKWVQGLKKTQIPMLFTNNSEKSLTCVSCGRSCGHTTQLPAQLHLKFSVMLFYCSQTIVSYYLLFLLYIQSDNFVRPLMRVHSNPHTLLVTLCGRRLNVCWLTTTRMAPWLRKRLKYHTLPP